MKMSETSS